MKLFLRSTLLILLDLIIVSVSYMVALWMRYDFSFSNRASFLLLIYYLPWIALVYLVLYKLFKVDRTLWKVAGIEEAFRIGISVFFSALLVGMFFLIRGITIPRSIHIIAFLLVVVAMEITRFFYRINRMFMSIQQQNEPDLVNTLVVGAGKAGAMLVREILDNNDYKNRIVGFIDDDLYKSGKLVSGIPILGTTEDIAEVVKDKKVNHVIIAMPSVSIKRQNDIIKQFYELRVKTEILTRSSDMINQPSKKISIRNLSIEDLLGRKEIVLDNQEISKLVASSIVLVTGAGGSIGSELCRQIVNYKPKMLIMMDINENSLYELDNELSYLISEGRLPSNVEILPIIKSIRDSRAVNELLGDYKVNIVFHAAAHKHVPLMETVPDEAIKNNIFGSYNMIEAAKKHKVKLFVSISTDKAVNPTNVMGATKRFVEKMIQSIGMNSNTKFVAVRFGNVLGSSGSVIPVFRKQIEAGGPVMVTHKDIIRYFMTIPEAVSLVLQAATFGNGGEIFVLEMGEPVKILDLAEKMIRLSGFKPYDDIDIKFTGLRPGEKLYEEIMMSEEGLRKTTNDLIYIAKPLEITSEEVLNDLAYLRAVLDDDHNKEDLVKALSKVVDTYHYTKGE
ncbi:MAG: nucleoside-diphosphate sugar epimerase/dehydratase [Erysipelotrichaceae bacterium]|nr:nucleoside-diphosphate sugar epimerase/dehydratase [Erysipelotrichaceae bacterium]